MLLFGQIFTQICFSKLTKLGRCDSSTKEWLKLGLQDCWNFLLRLLELPEYLKVPRSTSNYLNVPQNTSKAFYFIIFTGFIVRHVLLLLRPD